MRIFTVLQADADKSVWKMSGFLKSVSLLRGTLDSTVEGFDNASAASGKSVVKLEAFGDKKADTPPYTSPGLRLENGLTLSIIGTGAIVYVEIA